MGHRSSTHRFLAVQARIRAGALPWTRTVTLTSPEIPTVPTFPSPPGPFRPQAPSMRLLPSLTHRVQRWCIPLTWAAVLVLIEEGRSPETLQETPMLPAIPPPVISRPPTRSRHNMEAD